MNSRTGRILIVEDETAHAEAIQRAFNDAGTAAEVQVAGSLREYREKVVEKPPEIVLMDLNLPDGSAMEVLTFPPEAGPFPVLIMTSYGSEQIAVEALKAGALDYVVKSPEAFAAMPHTLARARREWKLLRGRKWAQEALRENQLRLQLALDAAEAGVWIWNVQTGAIFWDDRMQTIFGLEPGSFSGTLEGWLARVHPEDQGTALKVVLEALEQDRPYNFEYRVLGPNQESRLVNAQALVIRDKTGQPVKMAGLCRDITEHRRMEQAVRESEEKYRLLFENAPLGILHYNRDGIVTDCNEKFAEIIGASCQEICGFNLTQQICNEQMKQAALAALAGQPGYYEGDYIAVISGKHTAIRVFFQPVLSPAGDMVGGVSIFEDVSEKKRAIEEKQKLEAMLFQAQKMEAIGTLAGGIAHDFNNILAAIIGYTEMAVYSINDATKAEQYLDQVITASLRAKNLVDQILTFGRKLESEKKPVLLKLIIQEAVQLLRAGLPSTIEIQEHLLSQTPILADATQIHQIIMNLATNAYHAMGKTGGTLEIGLAEVQIDSPMPTSLGELQPGPYVKLQIKDTGSGIDPDILPRIFEPYFTTKKVGKGNGLGLATVLGITKSHGGEIVVESRPGQGTTFTLYFPQLVETRPTSPTTEPISWQQGAGHILFVDDELPLVELGAEVLNRIGYETTQTTSSLEALEIFRARPAGFDLVITDLAMPQLDGMELAKKFRAMRPDIPIIICTGYSERLNQDEIKEVGIKTVLKKPMSVNELAEIVQQILGTTPG